jgi:hypothetical protein
MQKRNNKMEINNIIRKKIELYISFEQIQVVRYLFFVYVNFSSGGKFYKMNPL